MVDESFELAERAAIRLIHEDFDDEYDDFGVSEEDDYEDEDEDLDDEDEYEDDDEGDY